MCLTHPGCVAPTGGADPEPQATESEEDPPEATLSVGELDQAITDALALGLPEPVTASDWLWGVATEESADPDACFSLTTVDTDTSLSWAGICTHDTRSVEGTLLLAVSDRLTDEGARALSLSYLGSLDGTREDAAWSVGGTGIAEILETPGGLAFKAEVGGTYSLGAGWATSAYDTSLALDGAQVDGERALSVEGGLTAPGQVSLYLRGLTFDTARCAAAPLGALSVRDPSSVWFEVVFGDACTGCGEVYWLDKAVGETCAGPALMAAAVAVVDRFAEELGP